MSLKNEVFGLLLFTVMTYPLPTFAASNSEVILIQRFLGDEDKGQCGYETADINAPFGKWSMPIYINTDNRRGGCVYAMTVLDPANDLAGFSLVLHFESYGTQPECDQVGDHIVPISRQAKTIKWSPTFRIDSDDRDGGCKLTFSVSGRSDVALDVDFVADGDAGQCQGEGRQTAFEGRSATIMISTDSRPGGCFLRLRMRNR